ncbi:MAG: GntR family transcriptional regulator [Bryobacteraceae bacterium]
MVRDCMSDRIRRLLSERILTGVYEPGHRLVELKIAKELNTSQGPVREAFRELEALGLVEVEPYKGTRVRRLSERDLQEAFEARAVIEQYAAELAAPRLRGNTAELRRQVAAIYKAANSGDIDYYATEDLPFHRRIVELSGNSILVRFWDALQFEVRTRILLSRNKVNLHESHQFHQRIVDALDEGNGKLAGELLREHITNFAEVLGAEADARDAASKSVIGKAAVEAHLT